MRRTYTTGLVVLTAVLLVLACFLFAHAQGGQRPEPQRSGRSSPTERREEGNNKSRGLGEATR